MNRHQLATAALVTIGITLFSSVPASAEPGSCITDRGCTSISVNGTGQSYRFASDDTNLDNNYYGSESIPRGESVNDSVSSVRNRRSTATRFCSYQNGTYTGTIYGNAPFDGANWVNTSNAGSSSVRFRSGNC